MKYGMSNPTVVALVGVRGGSQRVPNKNSRPFASSNLLAIKINQLRQVKGIDRIVVNSECSRLLGIAKSCGAETVVRDPRYATNQVLTSDYYRNIAENCDGDVILSATVTTPLIRPETYEDGLEAFKSSRGDHDSVTSCVPMKEFLYRDGVAYNYDPKAQVASQDLPNIVALNWCYSIIHREAMIRLKNVVGLRPMLRTMSRLESIDIDHEEDFLIAETLYRAFRERRVGRAA